MTSPVNLHIVPDCGLTIIPKLSEDLSDSLRRNCSLGLNSVSTGVIGKHALSYTIENIDAQGFPVALNECRNHPSLSESNKRDFVGVMSPLSPLSLPKQKKKLAGIDERATRYAFIHPPKGLAGSLDWAQIKVIWKQLKYHEKKMNESDHDDDDDDDSKILPPGSCSSDMSNNSFKNSLYGFSSRFGRKKNAIDRESSKPLIVPPSTTLLRKWALACFSLLGAFVYFKDEEDSFEVISVNALCLSNLGTNFGLRMAGPYQTPLETIQVLKRLNRFEVIPLEHFHEYGFVAKAWLCPREQGSSHGSFVFLREDNTALTYNIKSGADALRSGSRSILADLIDPHDLDFHMVMGQSFATAFLACNDDESCQKKFLRHFPSWSPLHYSCRFRSHDSELIKQLKEKYCENVSKLDRFGRSILHLACENPRVTGEVIRELLNNDDKSITKKLLLRKTKCYKRLPLHVAVNSNAPKEVIDELLFASKNRQTILEKTTEGRLPIHIAIENMADKSVIESLLKADIGKKSIYEDFKGLLPLHIACWNGHYDAVKLLLQYDDEGESLHYNISTAMYLKFKSKKDYLTFNTNGEALVVSQRKNVSKSKIYDDSDNNNPYVRALHIALLKCSDENSANITKLLLQREYWDMNSEEGLVTVNMLDSAGRNPLMLACMQNADADIINSLLNLDQTKNTAAQVDNFDNSALHYLCEHKLISESVVQRLLDAEDEYYSKSRASKQINSLPLPLKTMRSDVYKGSTIEKSSSKLNKQKMTPLKLAIRADAPTSVLKMLMASDRIDMKEFDDQTIHQLSLRVRDSKHLQESINHKLSARHSCFKLIMSLFVKVAIFVLYVVEADIYLKFEANYKGFLRVICFSIYSVLQIFQELHELIALGPTYLLSKKNWLDLSRISLVLASVYLFVEKRRSKYSSESPSELSSEDPSPTQSDTGSIAYILLVTTLLLGLDIILALRSTFLPFAKFAGGLVAIWRTLVPFFIVSLIFIVCFIVAFRVDAVLNLAEDEDDASIQCKNEFVTCFQAVLKAFLIGEFESSRPFYLVFGLVIILILLTIIIAIVSDAWDTVETKATEYYWESRITFLHEIQLSMFESKRQSRVKQIIVEFGNGIAEWVDDFGHVGLFQEREKFSWTRDSPYNQVADVQQYFKPQDYFHPDIAKVIKQARSLDADMYWISQKEEGWERRKKTTIAAMKWVGYYAIYLCLVVLGFVTGGFFWPTGLRRAILSYGYNSADGRQRDVGASKVQANESTEKRIEHNLMIPKKTSTRMFEDFFIEIMGVNPEVAQKIDSPSKLQLIADKIGVKLKRDCNGGCD